MVRRIVRAPLDGLVAVDRWIRHIFEGFIPSRFRVAIQPAEIQRLLERTMDANRKRTHRDAPTIVPNTYEVRMHPKDYATARDWGDPQRRDLEAHLRERAREQRVRFGQRIAVSYVEAPGVRHLSPRVEASFMEREARRPAPASGSTRAFRVQPAHEPARLTLRGLNGPFQDRRFEIAPGTTRIGRASSNQIVLENEHVSRAHAEIAFSGNQMRIRDLNSMNGTFVDGVQVAECDISPRNVVSIATHRFAVEATPESHSSR